jgi:hypothetical protein
MGRYKSKLIQLCNEICYKFDNIIVSTYHKLQLSFKI